MQKKNMTVTSHIALALSMTFAFGAASALANELPPVLQVTSHTIDSVSLSWQSPIGDGSPIDFLVEYKTSQASWISYQGITGVVNSGTVKNLNAGVLYSFRVTPVYLTGLGNTSNVVQEYPSAIAGIATVKITNLDDGNFLLKWGDADSNGSPILAYDIYFSKDSQTWSLLEHVLNDNTNSYKTDLAENLDPGSAFFFRVFGVNRDGSKNIADYIWWDTYNPLTMSMPRKCRFSKDYLALCPVLYGVGEGIIWAPSSSAWTPQESFPPLYCSGSGCKVEDQIAFQPGSNEYHFCLISVTGVRTCSLPSDRSAGGLPGDASLQKSIFLYWGWCSTKYPSWSKKCNWQSEPPISTAGSISFRKPSASIRILSHQAGAISMIADIQTDGGSSISSCNWEHSVDHGSTWISDNWTSCQVSALASYQVQYTYRVKAKNSKFYSDWSSPITEYISDLPSEPSISLTNRTSTSVSGVITVGKNGYISGGATSTLNEIQWSVDGSRWWTVSDHADNGDGTFSFTMNNLVFGRQYFLRSNLVNRDGVGKTSNVLPFIPSDVPGATAPSVSSHSVSSVGLSWVAPDNGGQPISDYVVQFSSDAGLNWTTFDDGVSSSTSTVVTGLVTGRLYQFRVAAANPAGQGSYSSTVSEKPSVLPQVSALVSQSKTDSTVTLSWAGTSNGDDISDYVVEYSANAGRTWTTFDDGVSSTASAVVTGLTRGTSYQFRVSAVNRDGQSNPPGVVNVTTGLSDQIKSLIVKVKGATKSGGKATAFTSGSMSGSKIIFQWLLDGKKISGATASTFTILKSHVGHKISLNATSKAKGFKDLVVVSAQIKITK